MPVCLIKVKENQKEGKGRGMDTCVCCVHLNKSGGKKERHGRKIDVYMPHVPLRV